MKNYTIIFLTSILSITISFSQEKSAYKYVAEYKLEWQPDSLNQNTKITTEAYSLYLNENHSFFISNNRLGLDTLVFTGKSHITDLGSLLGLPQPSSNKRIYNSINSKTLEVFDEIRGKVYDYADEVAITWNLTNKTDSIGNFKIHLATASFRGRNYEAWYCEDIPIPFGPYKFSGLPGLILKIYDQKQHISYSLISFQKASHLDDDFKDNYSKESTQTSKDKFLKSLENYRLNPIPLMESQGAVFDEKTKRIIRERFKEKEKVNNNKIEITQD